MSELGNDKLLAKCIAIVEDAKLFYRAHWSDVRDEDTVLVTERDHIQEARVVEIREHSFEGRLCYNVMLNPKYSQRRYKTVCWPDAIVYVQSRF